MGCGLDTTCEKMMNAITKTVEICNAHKKSIGMFMNDDNEAEFWYKRGMNFFWINTELGMLATEIARNKKRVDEF